MKTRRLLILWLCAVLLATLFSPWAMAEDTETIDVGYVSGFGLVRDIDSANNKGYGYELLERIKTYTNYTFEYHSYDQSEIFDALENGDIDIVAPVFVEDHGATGYVYSEQSMGSAQLVLAGKKDGVVYYYDDPAAFTSKTVMTYDANPANELLEAYAAEHSISFEYIYESVGSYDEPADFYLTSTISDVAAEELYSVLNLATREVRMVAKEENAHVLDTLDNALLNSLATDGDLIYDLHEKYYGSIPELSRRNLTREETESLDRIFNVAYLEDHQPFQFTNEHNLPDGISVEILNNLSQKYGFFVEYVPFNFSSIPEDHVLPDLLITLVGDYTGLMQDYTATEAYYNVPLMLVASSDTNIFSDLNTLGILDYSMIDKNQLIEKYGAEVKLFYNFDELITAYNNGEVDAIVVTESGNHYASVVIGEDNIQSYATNIDLPMNMYILNELADEYINTFNIMFDRVTQGEYDEIFSRQQASYLPAFTASDFIAQYWPYAVVALLAVGALFTINLIRQAARKQKAIDNVVNNDPISKHTSKRYFRDNAPQMIEGSHEKFEIISIDIDYFRMVNNLFGNEKGNEVIAAMASAIRDGLEETESLFYRATAEQFIILRRANEGITPFVMCKKHIEPAVKDVVGQSYNLSLSAGVCVMDDKKMTIATAIDFANIARLKGKIYHKITVHTFDKAMKNEYETRTNITYRMERALKDEEFYPVFQPKIDLDTLTINGAEALVRWQPKLGDPISPGTFIPVFETNGFIKELDLFMFHAVCKFMKAHYRTTPLPVISVNLSTITIVEEDILDKLMGILDKHKFKPSDFEIELTESALVDATDTVATRVLQLKHAGFIVALDDFGAGATTLNKLSSFSVDVLKLDKDFLDHNMGKVGGTIIVENIIRMAIELGMAVVCEGIETMEQAMWLKSLGCHTAQGYYFEKPVDEETFLALLNSHKVYDFDIPHDENSEYYEALSADQDNDEEDYIAYGGLDVVADEDEEDELENEPEVEPENEPGDDTEEVDERELRLKRVAEQRAKAKEITEKLAREREEERLLAKAKLAEIRKKGTTQQKEAARVESYKNSPAAQAREQNKAKAAQLEAQKRKAAKEKIRRSHEKSEEIILPDFLNTENMSEDAKKRVEALVAEIIRKRSSKN